MTRRETDRQRERGSDVTGSFIDGSRRTRVTGRRFCVALWTANLKKMTSRLVWVECGTDDKEAHDFTHETRGARWFGMLLPSLPRTRLEARAVHTRPTVRSIQCNSDRVVRLTVRDSAIACRSPGACVRRVLQDEQQRVRGREGLAKTAQACSRARHGRALLQGLCFMRPACKAGI